MAFSRISREGNKGKGATGESVKKPQSVKALEELGIPNDTRLMLPAKWRPKAERCSKKPCY